MCERKSLRKLGLERGAVCPHGGLTRQTGQRNLIGDVTLYFCSLGFSLCKSQMLCLTLRHWSPVFMAVISVDHSQGNISEWQGLKEKWYDFGDSGPVS